MLAQVHFQLAFPLILKPFRGGSVNMIYFLEIMITLNMEKQLHFCMLNLSN